MNKLSIRSIQVLLVLQLCRFQSASAQEGLSLRGNRPNDIMSIQMTPTSPHHSLSVDLKCFDSTEELRQAVKQYKSYNQIDTTLASTYGWPMNNWCVSNIQDFSNLFLRKTTFNEPLNNWDLSSATSLSGMFMSALAFDQDISQWQVNQVTDFSRMFAGAVVFNSDITSWNTTNANDMSYMFMHAHAFRHNLFEAWDVQHVLHMEDMFEDSRAMVDPDYDSNAWPLLKWQKGTPTIKLTAKEKRQQSCGSNLRACSS